MQSAQTAVYEASQSACKDSSSPEQAQQDGLAVLTPVIETWKTAMIEQHALVQSLLLDLQ